MTVREYLDQQIAKYEEDLKDSIEYNKGAYFAAKYIKSGFSNHFLDMEMEE